MTNQHRLCNICNHRHAGVAHVWGDSPAQIAAPSVKVIDVVAKKSTAARKDVRVGKMAAGDRALSPSETPAPPETSGHASAKSAGTQALPVDTNSTSKRGRKPVADPTPRQIYQRELMRKRRAAAKEANP